MAPKKGKDTLKDLSQFLQETRPSDSGSEEKEDFLKSKPSTLVNVSRLQDALEQPTGDPDVAFIKGALGKLAEMNGTDLRTELLSLVIHVIGEEEDPNPDDIMLLSLVQYIFHNLKRQQKMDDILNKEL